MKGWRSAVVLGVVALAWVFVLGPTQLGGPAAYVITSGNSMEPRIHTGDLVVTRAAGSYHVGDVVAYDNPELGRKVLHRIVRRDGDRFVVRGDHNTWDDSYQPRASEIIGRRWLRIPGGGRILGLLRPGALLIAGMALVLLAGSRGRARRSGDGDEGADGVVPRVRRPDRWATVRVASGALAALLVAGAAALWLAPSTTTGTRNVALRSEGTLGYGARVGSGPVYADGEVSTGDPVYLKLVHALDVTYRGRLEAGRDFDVHASGQIVAKVSERNGWHTEIPITSRRRVAVRRPELSGHLDLAALAAKLRAVESATGWNPGRYDVDLEATVFVDGTVEGRSFVRTFPTDLSLQMDTVSLRPGSGAPGAASGAPSAAPGTSEKLGHVAVPATVSATLPGPLSELSVEQGRLGLGLLAGLAVGWWIVSRRLDPADESEPERIAARYGDWLAPVEEASIRAGSALRLGSFEALVAMAERHAMPILHETRARSHRYALRADGIWYWYAACEDAEQPSLDNVRNLADHVGVDDRRGADGASTPALRPQPAS